MCALFGRGRLCGQDFIDQGPCHGRADPVGVRCPVYSLGEPDVKLSPCRRMTPPRLRFILVVVKGRRPCRVAAHMFQRKGPAGTGYAR